MRDNELDMGTPHPFEELRAYGYVGLILIGAIDASERAREARFRAPPDHNEDGALILPVFCFLRRVPWPSASSGSPDSKK